MVELDLEKHSDFELDIAAKPRRRIAYKPSMLSEVGRMPIQRKGVEQQQLPLLPEWMVPQELLPPFVYKISEQLGLSEKENRIHSALAGVFVWESFYTKYRDTLQSSRQIPLYLLEVIIPDLRNLIYSFSSELGRDVFAVSGSLERANHFITDTYRRGEYAKQSNVFLNSSPFIPLYRSATRKDLAPFHQLYDTVLLNSERFSHHSHDFFVNKDQAFFGWLFGNLKKHYSVK